MASTRNINNFNNYCHSQSELKRHRDYVIHPMKRNHHEPAFPNVGINAPQYMPNTALSNNSIDLESRLFGINATNLVNAVSRTTVSTVPEGADADDTYTTKTTITVNPNVTTPIQLR